MTDQEQKDLSTTEEVVKTDESADSATDEFEEVSVEDAKDKKIKNLISVCILLGGLFIGSVFVDVVQLVRGGGFSPRVLSKNDVFEAGGKTWVAYSDPIVKVSVVTDDSCEQCKPDEALSGIKRVIPTLLTEKIDANSDKGKEFVKKNGIKALPGFVFSKEIEKTELYAQAAQVFEKKDDVFVLNTQAVGLPAGKYLESPTVSEKDTQIGKKDAKVTIVEYSDFQCPFCKKLHQEVISKMLKEYGDKVNYVFKHFPLSIHPQAENASLAATCANEQGKFGQYADKLFAAQEQWGKTKGTDAFKGLAGQVAGINYTQFSKCLDEKKYQDVVKENLQQGQEYGISGTPSTFVGDQFMTNLQSYDDLKKAIDEQLAK